MAIFSPLKPAVKSLLIIVFASSLLASCGGGGPSAAADDQTDINTTPDTSPDTGSTDTNLTDNVEFSWVAPSEREDNTSISLSEIASYKIYYGETKGSYNYSVTINNNSAQSYTFTNLPAGTFHFVLTARDTDGRESQFSPVVTVVI